MVGLIAYGNSYDGILILDDIPHINNNTSIRSLANFADFAEVIAATPRPTVNVTLALNYAYEKLDSLKGYHLLNNLIHIACGILLFGVIRRTLDRMIERDANLPFTTTGFATAVALLWTAHPLNTQSVTYLIQRGESLMGMFYLLTLYCVIRATPSTRASTIWTLAAVGACALGMGAKPVMVTTPLIALLYDRTFFAHTFANALRRRPWLYAGLAATWGVLLVGGVFGKVLLGQGDGDVGAGFAVEEFSPLQYLLTQPAIIWHYIRLALWPHPLVLDYAWKPATGVLHVLPYAIPLAAILVASIWAVARRHWLGFVGAWFFVILAPTSSFVPIKDLAYEHRMYLSLAAVIAVIVASAGYLLKRLSHPIRRPVAGALIAVVAIGAVLRTRDRNTDYHSEFVMWQSVVNHRPHNVRALTNLGNAYLEKNQPQNALDLFERARDIDPTDSAPYCNIGVVYERIGQPEQALAAYEDALDVDPDSSTAHGNLGNVLMTLGRPSEAESHYQTAIAIDPDQLYAHFALGVLATQSGNWPDAQIHFQEAVRVEPLFGDACMKLADTLVQQRRLDEAIDQYEKCVAIDPTYPPARFRLAIAMFDVGRHEESAGALRRVLQLQPNHDQARAFLGIALYKIGQFPEAEATLLAALAQSPDHIRARFNLAELYIDTDRPIEAAEQFRQILNRRPNNPRARAALETLRMNHGVE